MGRLWSLFFLLAAAVAVVVTWVAPAEGWWLPTKAMSPLGAQIDDLFHLILVITTITFLGTQIVLGYVLWKFGGRPTEQTWFSHGSHKLEVIWTIVPAGILLFISLYQLDVWRRFRVKSAFPQEAYQEPIAEVTARQFEWRIRYPAPGKKLQPAPQPDDLYTVNDFHVPVNKKVSIKLRSEDVLHSFFLPHQRVKQDAVPGLVIDVWFESSQAGKFELVCAELCGWGHYKMRGQLTAEREETFQAYLKQLQATQFEDGSSLAKAEASGAQAQ